MASGYFLNKGHFLPISYLNGFSGCQTSPAGHFGPWFAPLPFASGFAGLPEEAKCPVKCR
jgi:hypothetical protein